MGQCVSQQPTFGRTSQSAPASSAQNQPSVSDMSQDNHSHDGLSESAAQEEKSQLDSGQAGLTSDYYVIPRKSLIRKSSRKTSISSLLPKVRGSIGKSRRDKDSNLSAAFNMAAVEFKVAMLDINAASEEELMTLSGINRPIAHEIIEHRNAIGGFKKVEDLALVSGVGAARLQTIKPEVCIGKKLSNSSMSVMTGEASTSSVNGNGDAISIASSPKPSEISRRRRRDPININTATIFQLMTVDGITQELAAHIVHYRERKGPFKTLYDLRKVSGFNCRLISALGPYLATENIVSRTPLQNGHTSSHRRTASLPSGPLLSPIGQNHPSRATLLSVPSPVYPSLSQFSRAVDGADISTPDGDTSENQGPAVIPPLSENGFRLLSWNLDALSVEKARNPGVIDVVSKILSRYNISVAVFQGISDPLLCEEINKQINDSSSPPYCCTATDTDVGYMHRIVTLQAHPSSSINYRALSMASIESHANIGFALVSCSLKGSPENGSPALSATVVPQLVKTVMDSSTSERILCLIDFSLNDHSLYVEEFQNLGYRPVVVKGESTSFIREKSVSKSEIHSNILVSRYAQKALNGHLGVIREGLTHLLIPNGWSWNGPASTYCPVWMELVTGNETDDEIP